MLGLSFVLTLHFYSNHNSARCEFSIEIHCPLQRYVCICLLKVFHRAKNKFNCLLHLFLWGWETIPILLKHRRIRSLFTHHHKQTFGKYFYLDSCVELNRIKKWLCIKNFFVLYIYPQNYNFFLIKLRIEIEFIFIRY